MHGPESLIINVAILGIAAAIIPAIIAVWVWLWHTPGWDHKPTRDEIREAVWRDLG